MAKTTQFHDAVLSTAQRSKESVIVFTVNGFKQPGIVTGHDDLTVMLESEGRLHMIYKHAISTVVLSQPVDLTAGAAKTE